MTGSTNEGWFRVGTVEVTTAVLAAGIAAVSIIVYAIVPSSASTLALTGDALTSMQLWRFLTWPLVNAPTIFVAIGVAMLWLFGQQLERVIGRNQFAWFLGFQVLIPGLILTPLAAVAGWGLLALGVSFLVDGIIAAFLAANPTARSFFNLPFWVVAAVFLAIEVLQLIAQRQAGLLLFLLLSVGLGFLQARAFGITEFEQIPKVPLPGFVTGDPYAKANRAREKARKHKPADVVPLRPNGGLDRAEQADMDALLDKINEEGIDSLNNFERARLDELSRRLRGE
jgi:hypothetical protein